MMSSQVNDEKLSAEDLMYIKLTISYFLADISMKDEMPLLEKVNRLWKKEANKNDQ